jgi:F-type H+-transporting ATPase subunit delta
MITSAVFTRYARALTDVALDGGEEVRVTEELSFWDDLFRSLPEFLTALDSPAVSRDAKEKLLAEVLSRHPVSKTTGNFIRLLLAHNRIRYFREIFAAYMREVNERKGIITARVAAAAPLGNAQLESLRETLSKATGKNVNLDVHTEADLLGGLMLQVGSTIYDGSIRKQLDEMRRRLREQ